ncbi:Hpt domain-containing protein [Aquamicrobium sp. NLF2-7]|uniref:Hpt domain-containing protein n=1 Tax=Aquamicrobium sp. NLF2-7 TaxID=2918753 RepID=UPI001EFBF386|nr:Hpt domain-containing protein [Aquamicrobium sp. NLF2-7]MCG8270648.1 Hpt domain-containing protein [Aquamicrobium sp. NLF2-7]
MGNAALQAEVLGLLDDQLRTVLSTIGDASPEERAALAHGLKGAARGVGAFALAEGADAVEKAPDLDDNLRRLDELAQAVLTFIARRRNGTHNG